jgi:signal transduction histidine kinase
VCAVVGVADPLLRWLDDRYIPGGPHFGLVIGPTTAPSWLVVAIGLVLLFAAPWVVHGLVRLDVYLMGRLLGGDPPGLDRGLADALQTLAARSPLPIAGTVDLPRRPMPAIETIAYFCVSELVTNVARHIGARQATVDVTERGGALELRVSDDGIGGAGAGTNGGTGLSGLADRVRTVDGTVSVSSPASGPTVVTIRLPWRT